MKGRGEGDEEREGEGEENVRGKLGRRVKKRRRMGWRGRRRDARRERGWGGRELPPNLSERFWTCFPVM